MSTDSEPIYGFGQPATDTEIAGWNIDVAPDGTGLPPGSGTVQQGEALFAKLGAACHGPQGEGTAAAPRLVGGRGTLDTNKPVKTVGSYWALRDGPSSTTSIAPCPPMRRSRSSPTRSTRSLPICSTQTASSPRMRSWTRTRCRASSMPNQAGFVSPDPRPDVFDSAAETTPASSS